MTQPLDVPPSDPSSTPEDPDEAPAPHPGEDPHATPVHPDRDRLARSQGGTSGA